MSSKPRAYLFVGGGTGGHLYPAIAIAGQIRSQDPQALVRFVCSDRPIDAEILISAGEEFTPIGAKPIARSRAGMIAFAKGWKSSSACSRELIYELLPTHDVVVVAMGGFVAGPAAWAARRMRVPVVLVNLDALPGKANLLIARFADRVYTALPVHNKHWEVLGPIVRASAMGTGGGGYGAFGLDPTKRTLLVTGGSQGAQSINGFMRAMMGNHQGAFDGWQIIHQTGGGGAGDLESVYEHAGIGAWVGEYIEDMGSAWAAADLTIGRCGAGTVSEAWAAGVPAVFMPYPYHKDQHQKHNAGVLVKFGAAVLFDDRVEPTKNIAEHGGRLVEILTDRDVLAQMHQGLNKLGNSDGAHNAAQRLVRFES